MMGQAVRDPAKWGSGPSALDDLVLQIEVAELRRDATALESFARRLSDESAAMGHELYRALADRALGVALVWGGARQQAGACFERAAAHFAARHVGFQLGRAQLAWGRAARDSGDASAARWHLLAAIEAFDDVGAAPAAEAARRERAALG